MHLCGVNKVLIIDDKYEEASPIIQALALKGISTIYWDGNEESKPEYALEGIRVVILDMRFTFVHDVRNTITILFTLLKNAISIKNGPYVLCMWTKHDSEFLDAFRSELPQHVDVPQPYLITNLEKNKFINIVSVENETYKEIASSLDSLVDEKARKEILQVIESINITEKIEKVKLVDDIIESLKVHLEQKISEVNSLSVLFMWESLVNSASNSLVNDISHLSKSGINWDNNIKRLIQQLALANAGKSMQTTAKEYIINAMSSLNQMLPDELCNQLQQKNIDEEKYNFIETPSILESIGDEVYSLLIGSKSFLVKKDNSDILTFKKIDETTGGKYENVAKGLYNQYVDSLGISNFKLLCESSAIGKMKKPGSVYKVTDECLLMELCNSLIKNTQDINLEDYTLVNVDISSSCDYAQGKIKRIRTIPGILFSDCNSPIFVDTEDKFVTPILKLDEKIIRIAFNLQYVFSEPFVELVEDNKLFSFRELYLTELKHKLSTYISRVGIINL